MRHRSFAAAITLALTLATGLPVQAESGAEQPALVAHAVLRNGVVAVEFDLRSGTYSVAMLDTEGPTIRGAHASVEGWASTDAKYRRRILDRNTKGMLIECSRTDTPSLLLEFTLHPAFIELRAGLKNTTSKPLRIKNIWPMSGGVVSPGAVWTAAHTLDAPSAAYQPTVTEQAVRSSPNNLLLTFKQDGIRRSLVWRAEDCPLHQVGTHAPQVCAGPSAMHKGSPGNAFSRLSSLWRHRSRPVAHSGSPRQALYVFKRGRSGGNRSIRWESCRIAG